MGIYLRKEMWWYSFKLPGQPRVRESTDIPAGPGAKEAAEDVYRDERKKAKQGKLFAHPSSITVKAALALYLDQYCQDDRPHTKYLKELAARHFVRFCGTRPWASIQMKDVIAFYNWRMKEGPCRKTHMHKRLNPLTPLRDLDTISHAFTMLAKDSDINVTHNPVIEANDSYFNERINPKKYRRKRVASKEEVKALWNSLSPVVRKAMVFNIVTGMRKGDVRNLRWDYIEFSKRLICLPAASTKEGADRVVPIHRDAQLILDSLPRLSDFVFCMEDGSQLKEFGIIRTEFDRAKAALGISNLQWRDLRHTFITLFLEDTRDLDSASRIAGHSDIKITSEIYNNVKASHLVTRIDEMRSVLSGVSEESPAISHIGVTLPAAEVVYSRN